MKAITSNVPRDRLPTETEFFVLATARLSLDVPEELTDPHVVPRHDGDGADPAVTAAIAAMPPGRIAAVLVPTIARAEPTVLFTQRTAHLADHAGQIAFPGGKIEAVTRARLRPHSARPRKKSRSTGASLSPSAILTFI